MGSLLPMVFETESEALSLLFSLPFPSRPKPASTPG